MRLPYTSLPEAPGPTMNTPFWPLAEMTLPAPPTPGAGGELARLLGGGKQAAVRAADGIAGRVGDVYAVGRIARPASPVMSTPM